MGGRQTYNDDQAFFVLLMKRYHLHHITVKTTQDIQRHFVPSLRNFKANSPSFSAAYGAENIGFSHALQMHSRVHLTPISSLVVCISSLPEARIATPEASTPLQT